MSLDQEIQFASAVGTWLAGIANCRREEVVRASGTQELVAKNDRTE